MENRYYVDLEKRLTEVLVGNFKDRYFGLLPSESTGTAESIQRMMENNQFRMVVHVAVAGVLHIVQEVNELHQIVVPPTGGTP